jgi:UDP-N-acetylglucosamine 2-epimerase
LREGLPADRIIKTGSPIYEVIQAYNAQIDNANVLSRLELKAEQYFLVSAHREENINSKNFFKLVTTLNLIAETYKLPIIVSTHPRTRNKIEETGVTFHSLIQLMKPLGFHDYNHLQKKAKAVLSDSGTISEESSIMNFPALNIREAHERPEAMEEASVMMVGLNPERIMQALKILEIQGRDENRTLQQVSDYSMPNVSDKVVRIILSYTDYINRTVWHKES